MAHHILRYELSLEADNDLDEIFGYTAEKFGNEQAVKYLLGFHQLFEHLCSHPQSGRSRSEVRKGLRSISYISHVVFYRILEDSLRIVRVLHASRDVAKFLPPQE